MTTTPFRMIQLRVLSDAWYESLVPDAKLLFLTCLLLPDVSPAGVVEVTVRRLSIYTGLDPEMVEKLLEVLEPKVRFFPEHHRVFITNYFEQQSQRSNPTSFRQGAVKSLVGEDPDILRAVWDRYPELQDGSPPDGPPPQATAQGEEEADGAVSGGDTDRGEAPPPPPPKKPRARKAPTKHKPDDQMEALLSKLRAIDEKWGGLAASPDPDRAAYAKLQRLLNDFGPGTVITALSRCVEGSIKVTGQDPYPLVMVICRKLKEGES